ncbi:MAG TPA: 50S ribosomal protein L44e [Candidatus Methanomethylia archaeon]|nr:50S ribosomal protein L44e [Candidatus Verstraetearchaeota archaeon]HDI46305.1 50S ribosomal protein L44e [Candidatus Methanomethylicia archaeon]
MKYPKEIRTYCPRCRRHTVHTVTLYKKGRERALAEGARRYARKKKGYGSSRKPVQKRFAKTTKRLAVKIKCKECGYQRQREGIRLKKLEIVEVGR